MPSKVEIKQLQVIEKQDFTRIDRREAEIRYAPGNDNNKELIMAF